MIEQNQKRFVNRLSKEKSPYLRQHQYNPVDWYPWCEEAFSKAREENKPIFLSIGYSTCHWCHIMARESFEDERVADFLNKHFISIKVDREERPDVDRVYMLFVQSLTGNGGWPLSVFLTPDGKPFFGGTYFPPSSPQRAGFLDVLKQIQEAWEYNRDEIINSSDEFQQKIQEWLDRSRSSQGDLPDNFLEKCIEMTESIFDDDYGGFGKTQKFPSSPLLDMLIYIYMRTGDRRALNMVIRTCNAMAKGGIFDHLSGGFHRYTVDQQWQLPHFEKTLYDNAQLLRIYAELFQITNNAYYADVAKQTANYLLADLYHTDGGFYSAEDADSDGEEGKYYLWRLDEVQGILTAEEAEYAQKFFGLTKKGNFIDFHKYGKDTGLNVLHIEQEAESEVEKELFERIRQKLFKARLQRNRPERDEKIVTLWNGLAIAGLSIGGRILNEKSWIEAARRTIKFIENNLYDKTTGKLAHSWCDGVRHTAVIQDSYAGMIYGLVEYYQATLEPEALEFAIKLADSMVSLFYDSDKGGFWQSPPSCADLFLKIKNIQDNAEPSGNSLAALSLIKSGIITGRDDFKEVATKTVNCFKGLIEESPISAPIMAICADHCRVEKLTLVVSSNNDDEGKEKVLQTCYKNYHPAIIIVGTEGDVNDFYRTLKSENKTVVYPCKGHTCSLPVPDIGTLNELLSTMFETH